MNIQLTIKIQLILNIQLTIKILSPLNIQLLSPLRRNTNPHTICKYGWHARTPSSINRLSESGECIWLWWRFQKTIEVRTYVRAFVKKICMFIVMGLNFLFDFYFNSLFYFYFFFILNFFFLIFIYFLFLVLYHQ